MDNNNLTSCLCLVLNPDHTILIGLENDRISSMAYRELVQPFVLETISTGSDVMVNQLQTIKDLIQKCDQRIKKISISLHSGLVQIKKIPVALGLDENALNDQMKWEANQMVASSIKEFIIDHNRLPFQTISGNPVQMLVIVRKQVIQVIQKMCTDLNLNILDVDVDIYSNIRGLKSNYSVNKLDITVLIDIQRYFVVFTFLKNGEYYLSHRVSFQEPEFVSGHLDSSGFAKFVLKELRRLMFGHRLGRDMNDLDSIFLMGSHGVRALYYALSDITTSPIEIVNPFRRIQMPSPTFQSKDPQNKPEMFVSAVGLAMKHKINVTTETIT